MYCWRTVHDFQSSLSKCVSSKLKYTNPLVRHYQWKTGTYGSKPRQLKNCVEVKSTSIRNELDYLACAYRRYGHLKAQVNPISLASVSCVPELNLERYVSDTNKIFSTDNFLGCKQFSGTLIEAQKLLEKTYSSQIGVEFMHLEDEIERLWFQERWEQLVNEEIEPSLQRDIVKDLIKSQVCDQFLSIKFVSLKRYGGEGCESQMAFYRELFNLAARDGVEEMVIGAHHRGRLNMMVNMLQMPPEIIFRKLAGKSEFPPEFKTIGDVLTHLCPSATLDIEGGRLNISMTNLPSHLEAVSAASLGHCRGIQQVLGDGAYNNSPELPCKVMNLQIHGDAAFVGQGVSYENVLLGQIPNFSVDGTIHLIVNNHLGFTTPPECGRGTRYASDVAKIVSSPVIHVNGEIPDDVIKATRIAFEYQRKFRKSVFVDLNCYRRRGHNELDDPTFTNPQLYKIITSKTTVPDLYARSIIEKGIMTKEEVENVKKDHHNFLNEALNSVDNFVPPAPRRELWSNYVSAPSAITEWDTGVREDLLKLIGSSSVKARDSFNLHPNIVKHHIQNRLNKLNAERNLDWATAEALAIGSLLYQGYNIRISGQDVGRGTFSHRHAMLVDQTTDDIYIPLNHMSDDQVGRLEIANSPLSEEAVLGFEYGFSTVSPNTLTIWEAQFGDFFNGAQIQIDTYIVAGEEKWTTMSGLTMLLPHGFDGAGAEHSSCRIERFLQLSNSSENKPDGEDVNIHVVYPTTPAQYFHLLRRQMIRNYRKPLIVVAPKILLRSPEASSDLVEMSPGTSFLPVLNDKISVDPSAIERLIFTSGKHYYALKSYQNQHGIKNTAIIRLEELVPFPTQHLRNLIALYKNAKEFIWSQEEPRNMGAWTFCCSRFQNLVGVKLKYTGRETAAAPAVAIGALHKKEVQMVVESPFK